MFSINFIKKINSSHIQRTMRKYNERRRIAKQFVKNYYVNNCTLFRVCLQIRFHGNSIYYQLLLFQTHYEINDVLQHVPWFQMLYFRC